MTTQTGLEDQLLGIMTSEEKPEVEHLKKELIVQSAENRSQAKVIEDDILRVRSKSTRSSALPTRPETPTRKWPCTRPHSSSPLPTWLTSTTCTSSRSPGLFASTKT
jgi:hypothetical protein